MNALRAVPVWVSRVVAVGAVIVGVGLLPWLSGQDAEYTVLRARYADLEATPEALARPRGTGAGRRAVGAVGQVARIGGDR